MKNFKYLTIVFLLMMSTVSCKKSFLEVSDNSNLNRQSYIKNLNTLEEFQRGIYMNLSTAYGSAGRIAYPDLIADNLKPSSPTSSIAIWYNWSQFAQLQEAGINSIWKELYGIIRSCNFVIEDVDKYAEENSEKAKDIKGQAYAIRALLHLTLSNIFAQPYAFTADASHPGIPYITTSDISQPYSRQTAAEVYGNLISDTENAISLMPANINDCRLMSRAAAKALLTRIYLYKGDFVNAKKLGLEVITQIPLMSIGTGYPVDLFKNKPVTQTEILWQLMPVSNNFAVSQPLGVSFAANATYRITNDVVKVLTENSSDIRSSWVINVSGQLRIRKFPLSVAGGIGLQPSADYYVPVLRSSEVFLSVAEACAKTNDEVNARVYLNAIRKRADPSISDVIASGSELLELIYKERRKELCFEGFRMWDLQRLKQGVQRTDVLSGFQTSLPFPSNKAIAPIPMSDVKLMGLGQNPSY